MSSTARLVILGALALLVSAACGSPASPGPTAGDAAAASLNSSGSGCGGRTPYTMRVRDPSFPEALVVCSDQGSQDTRFHQPTYHIANGTDNVWTVHSDDMRVPLVSASPDGIPSARVAVFRRAKGVSQAGWTANPYSWVLEPGTAAVVKPGLVDGILEVNRGYQGAWANYLALETLAGKAGTTIGALMENKQYGKAVASCVGFGTASFDLEPTVPDSVEKLQKDLSATAKGVQCGADLRTADNARRAEYDAGRTRISTIDGTRFSEELSRSASTFDKWISNGGKFLRGITNHV